MSGTPPIAVRIAALDAPRGAVLDRSELTQAIERELATLLQGQTGAPGVVVLDGGELAVAAPINAESAGRALAAYIHAGLRDHWGWS